MPVETVGQLTIKRPQLATSGSLPVGIREARGSRTATRESYVYRVQSRVSTALVTDVYDVPSLAAPQSPVYAALLPPVHAGSCHLHGNYQTRPMVAHVANRSFDADADCPSCHLRRTLSSPPTTHPTSEP